MLTREEIEHALAYQATQVERVAGAARTHQQAHLDRTLAGFGHLGHADPAIPQRFAPADALQFSTDRRNRGTIIQPQEGCAEQVSATPRPVLEGVLDEPGQRHHHPPLVPDAYHHVAAADLLDASPLALDDHHIVQPDRLGHCNLQASDQVAEHWLCGDTGHQADEARRGQQRGADLLHHGEGQQHQRSAQHDDAAHQHAAEHPRLGLDAARFQIIGDIDGMAAQDGPLTRCHCAYQQPDEAGGQCDMQHPLQVAQKGILQRRGLQRRNQQQQRPCGGHWQPEHTPDARAPPITPFQPMIDPQDQPRADTAHHHGQSQRPCVGLCALPVHPCHLQSNRQVDSLAHGT